MKKKVLVIDDEKELGLMTREVLADEGVDVSVAYTALDGLEVLKRSRYDVVLLDLKLPDENGLSLLKQIRDKDMMTRIVIVTAYGSIEAAVEAMKSGANDFLAKPLSPEVVREVVLKQLSGKFEEEAYPITMQDVEKRHIAYVLRLFRGNRRKTAEALGISLRTLYYKIKQFDLRDVR
ncbi:MAG: response regulator [Candidatus Carbobacillus sp.]|nr:response regulator [Candidatus Carbobacillus sp.]